LQALYIYIIEFILYYRNSWICPDSPSIYFDAPFIMLRISRGILYSVLRDHKTLAIFCVSAHNS